MRRFYLLTLKEIRTLFFSKPAILFLTIFSFLTGYSFFSAVALYSNASVSAINNPLYAAGFEPLPGLFVPLFGGLFLLLSLFLPFVIIPLIVSEKEQNTMVVLLQIPFSITQILFAKLCASLLFLLSTFLLMLPSTLMWWSWGGHIPGLELLVLHVGYFLYGFFVISLSFFSASLFKNSATASILALFLIMLSWIIDFGRDMNVSPFVLKLSAWTTSRMLGLFEQGLFSLTAIFYFVLLSAVFLLLARSFLEITIPLKWLYTTFLVMVFSCVIIGYSSFTVDVSESHRHSFPAHITNALQKLPPVEVSVYLRRTDSRFKDYEVMVLNRVFLVKDDMTVTMVQGAALDEKYGLFIYTVGNKTVETYSNSEDEIFPLLFELAGIENPEVGDGAVYSGYPLVVKEGELTLISLVYYLLIPLLFLAFFIIRRIYTKRRLLA